MVWDGIGWCLWHQIILDANCCKYTSLNCTECKYIDIDIGCQWMLYDGIL